MQSSVTRHGAEPSESSWLRTYYFTRAAVAAGWVVLAFTIGRSVLPIAGALLVVYPAWDALANWLDASKSGGLALNKSQALNLFVSALTAVAVAVALRWSMNAVLGVFGVWATLAGLFQLATAVQRWRRYGGQWAMALSGAQSAVVGTVFLHQAASPAVPNITAVAPYAALGAFYFLVSALWISVAMYRRRAA